MNKKYSIFPTGRFKKDLKKYLKFESKFYAIRDVVKLLEEDGSNAIPKNMVPHKLKGNYNGLWECHIQPDLLLIWDQDDSEFQITLHRVGTHSELF